MRCEQTGRFFARDAILDPEKCLGLEDCFALLGFVDPIAVPALLLRAQVGANKGPSRVAAKRHAGSGLVNTTCLNAAAATPDSLEDGAEILLEKPLLQKAKTRSSSSSSEIVWGSALRLAMQQA